MNIPQGVILIVSIFSFIVMAAEVWPGQGGKICFDTPGPAKYSGELVVLVDQRERASTLTDLILMEGKRFRSVAFSFKFENPGDPRVRIAQGSFYHVDMQVNPPTQCFRGAEEIPC